MKKNRLLRFSLMGLAIAATTVSLTASTFAFVIIGNNVYVSDFDFNIEGYEGLTISLDGENFSQDITSALIKEKISGSVEAFDNTTFTAVTPKQVLDGTAYKVSKTDGYLDFEMESIKDHVRDWTPAVKNTNYIAFDLWFRSLNTKSDVTTYKLAFGSDTKISADTLDVELFNTFVTETGGVKTTYVSGQTVKQNTANAMRIATNSDTLEKPLKIFEVNADPENDHGSAAIEGKSDSKHDKKNSMMVQYYNIVHPLEPIETAALDGEAYNTIASFGKTENDIYTGEVIGEFKQTDTIKVTVYIWLEGWDADYLLGTPKDGNNIKCDLEFILCQ